METAFLLEMETYFGILNLNFPSEKIIEFLKYSYYIIISFVCSQKYRKKFLFDTYLDFFPNNLAR